MKIQEQTEYFQTELSAWFKTPAGKDYAHNERLLWHELSEGAPMTHVLQLGKVSIDIELGSQVQPWVLDLTPELGANIVGIPEYLPFQDDCLDAVLLPHTLEAVANPYQALREAHRVLRPGGFLLITGFNPRSLFGLFGRWFDEGKTVHQSIRWIDVSRVEDWLELLGYEVHQVHYQSYRPVQSLRYFLNRQLPAMGNLYGIRARKNVHCATLNTQTSKLWQLQNPVKALTVRSHSRSRNDRNR